MSRDTSSNFESLSVSRGIRSSTSVVQLRAIPLSVGVGHLEGVGRVLTLYNLNLSWDHGLRETNLRFLALTGPLANKMDHSLVQLLNERM